MLCSIPHSGDTRSIHSMRWVCWSVGSELNRCCSGNKVALFLKLKRTHSNWHTHTHAHTHIHKWKQAVETSENKEWNNNNVKYERIRRALHETIIIWKNTHPASQSKHKNLHSTHFDHACSCTFSIQQTRNLFVCKMFLCSHRLQSM